MAGLGSGSGTNRGALAPAAEDVHVDVNLLVGDQAVRVAGLAVEVELLAVLPNKVGCTR